MSAETETDNEAGSEKGLVDTLKGFMALSPEKAATILPEFKANIERLHECHLQQNKLLKQMIYCVAIKALGVEQGDVAALIRGHTIRKRIWPPPGEQEVQPKYETVDGIDWKTGEALRTSISRATNQYVGIKTKDGRVLKFTIPIDDWETTVLKSWPAR